MPPFEAVDSAQFEPAFEIALTAHRTEVDSIGAQRELPSFENTVAAFDRSGRLLRRLEGLFYNLTSSETSPALQAVERRLAPRLAAHRSAVSMHAPLFARLEALHREREMLRLSPEQQRVLERYHLDFVRAGARLGSVEQKRYAVIIGAAGRADQPLRAERARR